MERWWQFSVDNLRLDEHDPLTFFALPMTRASSEKRCTPNFSAFELSTNKLCYTSIHPGSFRHFNIACWKVWGRGGGLGDKSHVWDVHPRRSLERPWLPACLHSAKNRGIMVSNIDVCSWQAIQLRGFSEEQLFLYRKTRPEKSMYNNCRLRLQFVGQATGSTGHGNLEEREFSKADNEITQKLSRVWGRPCFAG